MSSLLRIRHCLSNAIKSNVFSRNLAQAAMKEEVEIDQRNLPADFDTATFNLTDHRGPPSERVFRLVDEISSLTLTEAAELGHVMMNKMGIKEIPNVGFMRPGAVNLAGIGKTAEAVKEEQKPEKTVFELRLVSYEAPSKIKLIKEVRGFTDLGLKEANDLVEKTPTVIKKGVSKEEGERIVEKMKAVGAIVVLE